MSDMDSSLPPNTLLRAVGYATAAPDASESLRGILEESVSVCGADAGAVVDALDGSCRQAVGITPAEVTSLLEADPVREVLQRPDPWEEEILGSGSVPGAAAGPLLLVSLRVRGLAAGWLVLFFPVDAPLSNVDRRSLRGMAGLLALVLENDRLYEESRQATQARDHFLIALNHELRTPASGLSLMAELLRSGTYGSLPERLDRALRETEELVQQMMAVLRRVLDLAQAESQAAPHRGDIFQPRQVITDLLRRIEPAAKRKHLSLALYVPRTLPALQTDADRFSRILLYLLSNAIKFTAHGGIEVRVERRSRQLSAARQEPVLVVQVRDSGQGIPPDQIDRIFEPFAQVEEGARTDSRTRGIGLGLPLARQLARSLGGDITLESTLGRGTVATVFFPYTQHG